MDQQYPDPGMHGYAPQPPQYAHEGPPQPHAHEPVQQPQPVQQPMPQHFHQAPLQGYAEAPPAPVPVPVAPHGHPHPQVMQPAWDGMGYDDGLGQEGDDWMKSAGFVLLGGVLGYLLGSKGK